MLEGSLDDLLDPGGPHGVSGELTLQSCPLIYTEEARKHETFSRKLKGAACLNAVLCLVLSQLSFTT